MCALITRASIGLLFPNHSYPRRMHVMPLCLSYDALVSAGLKSDVCVKILIVASKMVGTVVLRSFAENCDLLNLRRRSCYLRKGQVPKALYLF